MTAMRVTHRLSSGYPAVELLPGIYCIEGRTVRSGAAMSKFGVTVEAVDSTDTIEVREEFFDRAADIAEAHRVGLRLERGPGPCSS